jgi:hypothetical protein
VVGHPLQEAGPQAGGGVRRVDGSSWNALEAAHGRDLLIGAEALQRLDLLIGAEALQRLDLLIGAEALQRLDLLIGVEGLQRLDLLIGVEGLQRLDLLIGVEALQRLVDVNLSAGDLLHELDSIRSRHSCRPVDPDLGQQRIETSAGGRVADAQVPLELLHVPARGEEHSQDIAIFVRQHAELARGESAGELRIASGAAQPGQGEPLVADGAVERRPAVSVAGH